MRNHKKERCVFGSFCLSLAPAGRMKALGFNLSQVSCVTHTCGHAERAFLIHMHAHTFMHTYTCACIHTHTYMHTHAHTYARYALTHAYTSHTHIYTYTRERTCTHIHVHTMASDLWPQRC